MNLDFRKELEGVSPYIPGKPIEDVIKEFNLTDVVKLASNENPLGCSPNVKQVILSSLDKIHLYPDGNCSLLKERLAKKFNLDISNILPSCGSDEMIDQIAKTFINKDDEVIMADVTFPRYISTCKIMGGKPVVVPMKDFTHDLDFMYKAITEKTKIIYICNPNNPTGTCIPTSDIINLLDRINSNILVVLDEAYREYVTRDDYMLDSEKLIEKYSNLLILRTFSKAYGLASFRVGYTIANSEVISNLNKVRCAFNVTTFSQVAALAALEDENFIKKSFALNKSEKEYLYNELKNLDLKYYPSETNHIFIEVPCNAFELFIDLQKRGVIIRPITANHIRVSIGLHIENEKFINEFSSILNYKISLA